MKRIKVILRKDWVFMDFNPKRTILGHHLTPEAEILIDMGGKYLEEIVNPNKKEEKLWVFPQTYVGLPEKIFRQWQITDDNIEQLGDDGVIIIDSNPF